MVHRMLRWFVLFYVFIIAMSASNLLTMWNPLQFELLRLYPDWNHNFPLMFNAAALLPVLLGPLNYLMLNKLQFRITTLFCCFLLCLSCLLRSFEAKGHVYLVLCGVSQLLAAFPAVLFSGGIFGKVAYSFFAPLQRHTILSVCYSGYFMGFLVSQITPTLAFTKDWSEDELRHVYFSITWSQCGLTFGLFVWGCLMLPNSPNSYLFQIFAQEMENVSGKMAMAVKKKGFWLWMLHFSTIFSPALFFMLISPPFTQDYTTNIIVPLKVRMIASGVLIIGVIVVSALSYGWKAYEKEITLSMHCLGCIGCVWYGLDYLGVVGTSLPGAAIAGSLMMVSSSTVSIAMQNAINSLQPVPDTITAMAMGWGGCLVTAVLVTLASLIKGFGWVPWILLGMKIVGIVLTIFTKFAAMRTIEETMMLICPRLETFYLSESGYGATITEVYI